MQRGVGMNTAMAFAMREINRDKRAMLSSGVVHDTEAIACKRCDYHKEIKDDSSGKDKLKEIRRATAMSKSEDSSKPVNLGEVTITIDDAVVHLVGMIDELSEETGRKIAG